jgi:predicted sulfurtransferase
MMSWSAAATTTIQRRIYWLPVALVSWHSHLITLPTGTTAFQHNLLTTSIQQLSCAWRLRGCDSTSPHQSRCRYAPSYLPLSTSTHDISHDIPAFTTGGPLAVLSQRPVLTNATELQMLSFYHFGELQDPLYFRDSLFNKVCDIPGLRGTFYLAKEGINAQLAVPPGDSLETLMKVCSTALPFDPFVNSTPNLGAVVSIHTPTFDKLIVRLRDYILRDGMSKDLNLDWSDAGPELSPSDWHDQVQRAGTILIDCRNVYESDQGTFDGAIALATETFQDSWSKLDDITADIPRESPIHIFCTGGIRCVKVGAYMKQHLKFSDVRRLKHGIIGYEKFLDEHPESGSSAFLGDNFLFDKRRFEKDEGSQQ